MSINEPQIEFTILPGVVSPIAEEQKMLFIGQKTASGSATGDTLVQNIGNLNEQDALFGSDSMLAGMIRAAKQYNKSTPMDAVVLDDEGGSAAATGTFVIVGTATAAGSFTFNVGSRRNHSFVISVVISDTATTIGDTLEGVINADTKAPFTATNVGGVVTITAANAGLIANSFGLEVIQPEGGIAGMVVTTTAMTGGATDPSLSSVFALIENIRYQTVIFPETYLLQAEAISLLNDRFNTGTDLLLDGVGIAFVTDTFANFLSLTTANNSQSFCLFANELVSDPRYKGSNLFEINYDSASQFGAVRALRLTQGSDLSELVIGTSGALDKRGGIHISTLPYHNTPFKNLPLIDADREFSLTEVNFLTDAGWSVIGNNIARTEAIAAEIVTRYQTDAAGDPDLSFKFLNFVDQASTVRDVFHTELKETYRQFRLTEGDLRPGFNITNEADIRGEILNIYNQLADLVIVVAGTDALTLFKENLVITLDAVNGLVTISMLDPVVTQLRKMVITMQLIFSLNT